jgi:hypothetical protein
MISPVVVVVNKLKPFTHALPRHTGDYYQGSSKWLFCFLRAQPPMCRGKHGRHGGELLLWGRYERAARVAKIVPFTERLSGMCGSVEHRRLVLFTEEG